MRKRKERTIKELYGITEMILQPEITPVLKGSCRIQGPVDELEHDLQTNSGIFPAENTFSYVTETRQMRAESGTCNVCSAPCSSCMHFNRTVPVMESKFEGQISTIALGIKETDSCSCIGDEDLPLYKSRTCLDGQLAASESSHLLSASSSHDSYSENAESKATLRTSVTYDASEDIDMPPKASSVEAFSKDHLFPEQTNATARNVRSSQNYTTSDLSLRVPSSRDEEQRGLECHGDNTSCITGARDANIAVLDHNSDLDKKDIACCSVSTRNLLVKGTEKENRVEITHDYCVREIEESQTDPKKPSTCLKESLRNKCPGSTSGNAGSSPKSDLTLRSPLKKNNPFAKEQSPHPCSQSGYSFHHSANSKDLAEISSSQCQGEPSECSMDRVESIVAGPLSTGRVDERKCTAVSIHETSKASCIRSERSSPDEALQSSKMNEQFEKSSSLLEVSNMQTPQTQPKPILESENSESDIAEDDVKVCDICGDAGQEELLALCSRSCCDGAEHTYCMRIMLDKIPEGDWLCEGCKLKEETQDKNLDKSEIVPGTSKVQCLNVKSHISVSTFNPKLLPKLDTKEIDQEPRGAVKGLHSPQVPAMRQPDILEVTSITSKKASETNSGSMGTVSPRKKSALSRECSFKNLDVGKVKPANLAPSYGGLSASGTQAIACSQTSLGSNSSKVQAQLQSPRGLLSKSVSFKNPNLKPKVKQLIDVPHKQKLTREFASGTRKEELDRKITKSASFKSMSTSRCNIKSISRTQSLNLPRTEDSRGMKQVKGKKMIDKNSFTLDHPLVSPSPTISSAPLPKADLKVALHDGKVNKSSESNILGVNKGTDDANDLGCNEVKKPPSFLAKSSGSASLNGIRNSVNQKPSEVVPEEDVCASSFAADTLCSNLDTIPRHGVPHTRETTNRDEKPKDPTLLSSSRQAVSGGGRLLRCQRCNETGHATQFCSIDKLRTSASKPFAEQNSREVANKSNKWKDAAKAAISKSRTQKDNRFPDQSEVSKSLTALSSEVASKDLLSSPPCSRNSPFLERTTDGKEILASSATDPSNTVLIDAKEQAVYLVESACVPREGDSSVIPTVSDELNVKPFIQILSDRASVPANPLRASAIPELDFIWQGSLEVQRTGRISELCDGIQAHLSTHASPKVLEVVNKFTCKIQLEEVPRLSSWPLQFQRNCPTEDNIALFFFAKDTESYEKRYRKLLDNMLSKDLALIGNFDGIELLIFPSNKLPENSQRWNRLFFLWGLFRKRRTNCLEALPSFQKKPCWSSLKSEPLVQDLPTTINSYGNLDKELSKFKRLPNAKAVKSPPLVDFRPLSSLGTEDKICRTDETPFARKSLYQADIDNKLSSDHTLCSFPVSSTLKTMSYLPSLHDTFPESRLQMSSAKLCLEPESDTTSLKKICSNLEDGKDAESPARIHSDCVQISLSKGSEGSGIEEKMKEKNSSIKSEAALCKDLVGNLTGDHHNSVLRPKRRREDSCSMETVSETSGGISKSTCETIPWKEKSNCILIDDEKECKKMKLCSEGRGDSSSGEESLSGPLSSKIHPLLASLLSDQHQRDGAHDEKLMPGSSSSSEMHLFPVDLFPVRDTKRSKTDNIIEILSSDDEDPHLELALWGKKKSPNQGILPFVDKESNQDRFHSPAAADDGDDVSASLSLSLAFPFSK